MQNTNPLSRRDFLKTSAGLGLAVGLQGASGLAATAEKPNRWTVAIRDGHLKMTGQPDCWSALKFLGVPGIEVGVSEELACYGLNPPGEPYSVATADGIKRLSDDVSAHGAKITALCMNNRLDERLDRELIWTRKLVPIAQQLGVTAIRIDVVPHKMAVADYLPFAINACRQMCDIAEGTPVRFAIENHGHVTNDPVFLEKLFDGVHSNHLGLTLDTMNFYWFGHPLDEVYRIVEKFAAFAYHTHCKNLRYPVDQKNVRRAIGWEYDKYSAALDEGDIDYRKITASLRKVNYQGDLCLENECLHHFPKEQHPAVLKKELALLQSLA